MKRTRFLASGAAATVAAIPGLAFASADLSLTTPTGKLAGTLEVSSVAGPQPVVLLVAGSGPTDRDGNNPLLPGKNDALKLLAIGLARRGIASLRYDKRGIGASTSTLAEKDLRFDDFVADAVAWLRELRAQRRFSRVAIAGHSEGALIATVAALREPVEGVVTLEGAGRPAATVLREQLAAQLPAGSPLLSAADRIVGELSAGRTTPDVPATLAAAFRPSVQPYLISWFRYDPARELGLVTAPRAIVQGTADVQVTRTDGDALHAAAPAARGTVVRTTMSSSTRRTPPRRAPSWPATPTRRSRSSTPPTRSPPSRSAIAERRQPASGVANLGAARRAKARNSTRRSAASSSVSARRARRPRRRPCAAACGRAGTDRRRTRRRPCRDR